MISLSSYRNKRMNDKMMNSTELLNRLDRLPIWPYPKKVLLIIGIGFFFSFFDIVTIGLALPKLEHEFNVSTHFSVWAITSSLAGYIIGSFLDSRIADLFGRKLALYLSILFFSIGSLFCALSPNMISIILWRFVTGMGIGSEIAGISTYMAELSPAHYRGKATSFAIAAGMFGFAIVPFIALTLIPRFDWGWRLLFLIGAMGGLITFFMRRTIPQSPRWLVACRRKAEALAIIEQSEKFVAKQYAHQIPYVPVSQSEPLIPFSLKDIFSSFYLWRLILFTSIWFTYYIGNYAWLSLATDLFVKHGFKLSQSLTFVSIASLGFILGSFVAIILGDWFERKWLGFTLAIIWSIALLIIGWYPSNTVIYVCGFIATMTISAIIPILYTYTAENFPTSQRATCVSITDGLGHLGGAFCGQIIFAIYYSFTHPYTSFAAAFSGMAITGILTAILLTFGKKMTRQPVI